MGKLINTALGINDLSASPLLDYYRELKWIWSAYLSMSHSVLKTNPVLISTQKPHLFLIKALFLIPLMDKR